MVFKSEKMQYKYIDGKNFYFMFLAGAKNIIENYGYLNQINVFPVPDGDTGSNMASTVQSVIDQVKPTRNLGKTLGDMADAALVGARGNSGIIVAQFIQGLSNELSPYARADVSAFVKGVDGAVDFTYTALANPVEGTILTVFRAWANEMNRVLTTTDDFVSLLTESYEKTKEALEETRSKLRQITKANVVDAGAQGFVFFIKGMMDFAAQGDMKGLVGARQNLLPELDVIDTEGFITYRYCTESFAVGENIDKDYIRQQLGKVGDSVVVAGSNTKIRIHVHTDTPQAAIKLLSEHATVQSAKVDDMLFQTEIRERRRHDVAIMVDSSSDLSKDIMWKYQIHSVPLQVQLGENIYLDGITLEHDDFYTYLASDQPYPKTSLPALKDIYNKMSYLATFYKAVLVVNVSSGLSGTWQACRDMAEKVQMQTGVPIITFDTKTLAGAQGLIALRAAQALDKNMGYEDLVRLIPIWCEMSNVYAITKTVKYFVKGGRISKMKGFMASLFGVAPVITPDKDGKGSVLLKSVNQAKNIDKVIKIIDEKMKTGRLHSYCVEYTNKESKPVAEAMVPRLRKITGLEPAFVGQVTPVVGNNAGVGTVAIAILMQ